MHVPSLGLKGHCPPLALLLLFLEPCHQCLTKPRCDRKPLKWPSDPHLLGLISCLILSHWVLAGPSASLLMNKIQQKTWAGTSDIRLRKDFVTSILLSLSCSLAGKL